MKKRVISALLIGAMAVSMAAGCGQNNTENANNASVGAEQNTAKTESNQILFNGSSTLAPVIISGNHKIRKVYIFLQKNKIDSPNR